MNVKKSIAKYILTECLEVSLVEFFERFQVEYEYPYNLKLFPNRMVRLSEYLAGLPSTINIPSYYHEIRELVLKFEPEASDRTLKRWENNFFKIVADILLDFYVNKEIVCKVELNKWCRLYVKGMQGYVCKILNVDGDNCQIEYVNRRSGFLDKKTLKLKDIEHATYQDSQPAVDYIFGG